MVTRAKEPADKSEAPAPPPDSSPERKRKRYSKNAKATQQFERRISKSARRIAKSVKKGIDTYLTERDSSLERRRDGAILESYVNVAKGVSEGIVEASPAIVDVANAVNSKRTRRVLRQIVRALPLPR